MFEALMWKAVKTLAIGALPHVRHVALRAAAPAAVVNVASARNRTLLLAGAALAVTALVARRRASKRGATPRS